MNNKFRLAVMASWIMTLPVCALADTTSYTGTLTNSTGDYELTLSVSGAEDVTVQTWGFGGGTNAAGDTIAAGGFDPFIGLFSGTGASANILTDGSGDPHGTSDALSNFASFAGCPPARTMDIGGVVCGDITMSVALAAGTYTLLLSDAAYLPNAVFDNGTLGEGFTDLTGGAFQTCNTDMTGATTCANDTGNWAFDVTTSSKAVSTPEPAGLASLIVGLGVLTVGGRRRRLRETGSVSFKK
jgi:hypothetical protein